MKLFLPALFAVGLMCSPAGATPLMPAKHIIATGEPMTIQAKSGNKHKFNKRGKRGHSNRHFRAGGHRSAPHGWRRYGGRPHDWRTRGCIAIGPVWYCP